MSAPTPPRNGVTRVYLGVEVVDAGGRHTYEVSGEPISPTDVRLEPEHGADGLPQRVRVSLNTVLGPLDAETLFATRSFPLEVEQ